MPHNSVIYHKNIVTKRKRHPHHIRRLMIKIRHLWKELRNGIGDLNKRLQYRSCTNESTAKARLLIEQKEINVIDANNIGLFYKHINNRIAYRKLGL